MEECSTNCADADDHASRGIASAHILIPRPTDERLLGPAAIG